jgi:hypothetical protein
VTTAPDAPLGGPPAARSLTRVRWAVTAVFFIIGLLLSVWFTQIPQLRHALHLSDGELGVVLLFPAVGALLSMQVAGRLPAASVAGPCCGSAEWPSRRPCR